MHMSFYKMLAAMLLVVSVAVPLSVAAAGLSFPFGGRVLAVIPCAGGMFQVTIIPTSKVMPISYIWTPFTITKLVGLPVPGGQILGLADLPWVCFVGGGFFTSPVPLFGFRMQYIGTSFGFPASPVSANPLTS